MVRKALPLIALASPSHQRRPHDRALVIIPALLQLVQHSLLVTRNLISNVENALASLTILPNKVEQPAWIDCQEQPFPASEALAMAAELVHLPSLVSGLRCTHALTPKFFSANTLTYRYDPIAPQPRCWLEFLGQLWPQDAQSIETLQDGLDTCWRPTLPSRKS
jgi:hypothetical protein